MGKVFQAPPSNINYSDRVHSNVRLGIVKLGGKSVSDNGAYISEPVRNGKEGNFSPLRKLTQARHGAQNKVSQMAGDARESVRSNLQSAKLGLGDALSETIPKAALESRVGKQGGVQKMRKGCFFVVFEKWI
jgi:hypothetical protein